MTGRGNFPSVHVVNRAEGVGDALETIRDAKKGWLELSLEDGMEIPEAVGNDEYSGKFNIRMPKSLHAILVKKAKAENVSLSQYVNYQLARGVAYPLREKKKRIVFNRDNKSILHAPN
jgi:antitoxin HicB